MTSPTTGITEKVSYFKSINVGAVWLSPIFLSPQNDFGYDISDYKEIDPLYGTMADFEQMRDEFHRQGESWGRIRARLTQPLPAKRPCSQASRCCWTSCRTTRATNTNGSKSPSGKSNRSPTTTCGRTRSSTNTATGRRRPTG